MKVDSNVSTPTKFIQVGNETYAYRRFGNGSGLPLLFLQHFTGTLDNWDPTVTDPLAAGREVILFDNAGIGRSSGKVPQTIAGMAEHALAFVDATDLTEVDILGFSLGGNIKQPCLVVNGIFDNMIPVRNSYFLAEHLPNAMLLIYPDAGHGSLFQFH